MGANRKDRLIVVVGTKLTEEMAERVRKKAKEMGFTVSEYLRKLIEADLNSETTPPINNPIILETALGRINTKLHVLFRMQERFNQFLEKVEYLG